MEKRNLRYGLAAMCIGVGQGIATIIDKNDAIFAAKAELLRGLFGTDYSFFSLINIEVVKVKPIIAPSYFLFPERTEQSRIDSAMKTYQVRSEK